MLRSLSDLDWVVISELLVGPGGTAHQPGPAWSPRRRLEVISSAGVVAGLVDDGWLETWVELDCLTLSPLGAVVLGVRLECGEDEAEPYWVEAARPERSPKLARWMVSLGNLDHLPDPKRVEVEVNPEREEQKKPTGLAGGLGRILGLPKARGRRPGRSLAG
jgi:hypothetical protein